MGNLEGGKRIKPLSIANAARLNAKEQPATKNIITLADKVNEITAELDTAMATIKELKPLLEYTKLKMAKEKTAEALDYLKGKSVDN